MNDNYVYDLETYPNIFTASFLHVETGLETTFEISDRKNQLKELLDFLVHLRRSKSNMIGFKNLEFDYPIIHFIFMNRIVTLEQIYIKANEIISTPYGHRQDRSNIIWDNQILIPQIDLYKIHHFDNASKRTSLKVLEFNMRSENIKDLPYPPGTILGDDQKDELIIYNKHDVKETYKFYLKSLKEIEFRKNLGKNWINYNDTKIGKQYFINELEKQLPGSCYIKGTRKPKQTRREKINLSEVIFQYINFEQPEFTRVKNWLFDQSITETKGVFKKLIVSVNGFNYCFGSGGIHGSIEPSVVRSNENYVIYDWDVASYYPNLAISNRLYPEHLSEKFCEIYEDVYLKRQTFKKGTVENATLKLALNGVYGDSNNKYSPFYDPKYTMSITINGQLLLCILAEQLIKIPNLKMIQINTDGLTVLCPRDRVLDMNEICKKWQNFTCLQLEHAIYSNMYIRDVNNYIAQYENGKIKRKGAYEYDKEWHKDHSQLIVPKAVEAYLIENKNIDSYIKNHNDIFDFMLRTKLNRSDILFHGKNEIQRTSRYYMTTDGEPLKKISLPPKGKQVGQWKIKAGITKDYYQPIINELINFNDNNLNEKEIDSIGCNWDERIHTKAKTKYKERETRFHVGYNCSIANNIKDASFDNINYDYYISEAEKLLCMVE